MVIDRIKKDALENKVMVFFDMDGVMAEYGSGEKNAIFTNQPGFYFNRRPIKTIINIVKELNDLDNVEVGIISNCYYEEQKQDKLKWLEINLPFLKREYICIIKLKDEEYTKETKDFIKSKYLKNMIIDKDVKVYFFEDDHGIIKATKKALDYVNVEHVSTLLD